MSPCMSRSAYVCHDRHQVYLALGVGVALPEWNQAIGFAGNGSEYALFACAEESPRGTIVNCSVTKV